MSGEPGPAPSQRTMDLAAEYFFAFAGDPCMLFSVEDDGRLIRRAVNPAYERATGLQAQQVVGHDRFDFLSAEVAELVVARLRRCADTMLVQEFDEELSFPLGRRFWQTRLVPLLGPDGRVSHILGFARDLTEQQRAIEELRASEARYRTLIETLHEGIWQVDADAFTTFVNPRLAQMLGYSVDEMLGKHLFDFTDAPGVAQTKSNLQKREEGIREVHTFEFLRKDGTRLHALLATSPIYDEDGNYAGALAGVQDLTAIRAAEAERHRLQVKLQETQKLESLGILAGGIAHDFNNILTGILGSASLARSSGSSAEFEDLLGHIESSAQRAAELCRQMLAYAGKGKLRLQRIDLSQLVRETTELLRVSIGPTVSIRFDLAEDLPTIEGDATQIRQVLMNLVLNAAEAVSQASPPAPPGVLTLATGSAHIDEDYVQSTCDDDIAPGEYVVLEVTDNGSGMSAATIAKIFDPFFSTKFTGRGLGLSAVLGIVRGHRGAIEVASELGEGTTFKLLFPAARGPADAAAPGSGSTQPQTSSGAVLVVDDEEVVRKVASRILEDQGFEVVTAADGVQALEILREDPEAFVAVLMDLTMPNMDGVTAFRELRRVNPNLRLLLMSGYSEQDVTARFSGTGLAGFLQKPFSAQALRDKLAEVLNGELTRS